MTIVDPGIMGAKVQSWRAGPRLLVQQVAEKNPKLVDDDDALFRKFIAELEKSEDADDLTRTMLRSWFANAIRAWRDRRFAPDAEERAAERAATKAAQRAVVEKIKEKHVELVKREVQLKLLDMVVIVGKNKEKKLRDCTGRECSKLEGWLGKIAGKVKANETVGKVLTEAEVRKLYGS